MNDERGTMNVGPTLVRGVLYLLPSPFPLPRGEGQEAREWNLLDIAGRKVLDLVPGPNDVSGIAPGVYFIHSNTDNRQAEMTKLVVTR